MRKENGLLLSLTAALVFLLIFFPAIGWKIKNLFSSAGVSSSDFQKLESKNAYLETELAKSKAFELTGPNNSIAAFVYSRYPFNFKNELLINLGAKDGIEEGQPAILAPGDSSSTILIGKVEKVFSDSALVETVFDSRFQYAARIGSSGTNTLLKGGSEPQLTLIPKDAEIKEGDPVYSAGADFPYGLTFGLVKNLRFSSDQVFQQADLETSYSINALQTISIIKSNVQN